MSSLPRLRRLMVALLPLAVAINAAVAFSPRKILSHHSFRRLRSAGSAPESRVPLSRRSLWMKLSENNGDQTDHERKSIGVTKLLLPVTAVVSISLVTLSAATQHLPGPPIDATAAPPFLSTVPFGVIFSGSCEPYSTSLVLRDLGSTIFSIIAAAGYVKSITYQVKLSKLDPRDARKLIHTLSAPLFIFVWPLFSNAYGARVFATIVPLLNAIRLYVAGTETEVGSSSKGSNEQSYEKERSGSETELANAISRSGDAKEALQGPFVYVMVLLFSTLVFWLDSPIGIVSIATMAVGDGLADLVGRRFGATNKWPFNKSKSIAGSSAFVLGSLVGSFGLLTWLVYCGVMEPLPYDSFDLLSRLFIIAIVCAGVELLGFVDDNYSVPISAGILSAFLLN